MANTYSHSHSQSHRLPAVYSAERKGRGKEGEGGEAGRTSGSGTGTTGHIAQVLLLSRKQ